MTEPRALIVMVHYNRPNMALNALRSAQWQTDKRWHLAFIDDGSRLLPDHALVRDERPNVTRYSIQYDGERGDSRHPEMMNRAVLECPGELVVILCDDDALHPTCVKNVIRWFGEHSDYAYGWGNVIPFNPFTEDPGPHLPERSHSLNDHDGAINPVCQVDSTQVVYRASAIREDGIRYPSPATADLDAKLYKQLHRTYGDCPPMGFVTQYKGIHDDQMGARRRRGQDHGPKDLPA